VETEEFVQTYNILQTVQAPLTPAGVRVVTRNSGRFVDVVASPSSSYLLPELSEFSLLKREARYPGVGAITLCGDQVRVDKFDDALLARQQSSDWGLVVSPAAMPSGVIAKLLTPATAGLAMSSVLRERSRPSGAPPTAVAVSPPSTDTVRAAHVDESLPADASIASIASRIAALTELSDEMLADLFKVERETFCRWRTGALANPRPRNRRRLSLLLTVLEDLRGRDVAIREWLLNHTTDGGDTPYELLLKGQIDGVAYAAAEVGEPAVARDPRLSLGGDAESLQFGDDDSWEPDLGDDDR
jgi:hypothetical protein